MKENIKLITIGCSHLLATLCHRQIRLWRKGLFIILVLIISALWGIAGETGIVSLEGTQKIAKETGKDILIDFSGSDWCGWCIRLDKEVFSTAYWKKESVKKYILIVLDFPRKTEIPKEQKEYNNKISRIFGIAGFPTVMVLDSNGKPYARTGYKEGGPEKYLAHLEPFISRKKERDDLLAQAKAAPADKRIPILEQLIAKLNEWEVGFGYPEIKEEIVTLDADNGAGLRLKYALQLIQDYQTRDNKEKIQSYLNIIKQIDPAKAKELEFDIMINEIEFKYLRQEDWKGALDPLNKLLELKPEGESAQKIYYLIAMSYHRLKDETKSNENLEKAISYAPNSQLGKKIQGILDSMKNDKKSPESPPK